MTKIDIISGFLGAGKTTLIKKILEKGTSKERIALIENEFGEVGIDGALLKEYGISITEMNSGCICCTIAGDFSLALKEILTNYKPDRVIIEPTGVGKLSDVLRGCEKFLKEGEVVINLCITVMDGTKYKMYLKNFTEFYKDQLLYSKVIVISRTQQMEPSRLDEVVRDVQRQNPKARIVASDWSHLSGNLLLELCEGREIPKMEGKKEHHHGHHANELFRVWSRETAKIFSERELKETIRKLDGMEGIILRAKGIVEVENKKWIQFNYVPGEVEIGPIEAGEKGKVCVIGNGINENQLSSLFQI